jgi:hypothetical protein
MAMVTCKNCGHEMSTIWAHMTNQCSNCKRELYSPNETVNCADTQTITMKNGQTVTIGQEFYMSHRLSPQPRLFKYIGRNYEWYEKCCNFVVVEVETGEVNHIEPEWFNQRTIRLVD